MVKTQFSLSKSMLERIEALAREMKISRSRLLAIAFEDFFRHYQNRQLLEQINQAYQDGPDEEEQKWLMHAQQSYRLLLEDEW